MRRLVLASGRMVYCPDQLTRLKLSRHHPYLQQLAAALDQVPVGWAFLPGRSLRHMARLHVGANVSVSLDLAGWFDSVRRDQLDGWVDPAVLDDCLLDGRPAQGLSTSPYLATIAASVHLDPPLVAYAQATGWTYSRYADDLTFSSAHTTAEAANSLVAQVERCTLQLGWRIRADKTRVQWARDGRRVICGLSIGPTDVRCPRAVRRRLRAALHQYPTSQRTRGLAAWVEYAGGEQ